MLSKIGGYIILVLIVYVFFKILDIIKEFVIDILSLILFKEELEILLYNLLWGIILI